MRALGLIVVVFLLPLIALAQNAPPPTAQAPAVLVADEVFVTAEKVLVASGNVEIFQGNVSLSAQSITYNQDTEQLTFEGPLTMQDGERILVLADAAELSPDLRNGILRSARLVLDQQVQLAAVQIDRVDGRYSQLYKASVTSCRICETGRVPLWQIRARRVIHDREERQLYFDDAQFRIGRIPVFYFPRLRLPDPTLDRATGFLIPSIKTTSQLGTGIRIPYFIKLGDHRDLTLEPYLAQDTRTLQFRYRQAFTSGNIEFNGAFTRDTLLSGEDRYYLFGFGAFSLPRDFVLTFDIETTSDDAYLRQYDYSEKDRLDSEIALTRVRRNDYTRARLIGFESLRPGESDSTLETLLVDATYERRVFPARLGGELRFELAAHTHQRTSENPVDGQGRDVSRVHAEAAYLKSWTMPYGLRADSQLVLGIDAFDTRQDDTFSGSEQQFVPQAAIALRYPMSKTTPDGTVHFLEPVVQLAWTGGSQSDVANDESTRVEFDEGNLLALSRFAEKDRREHGLALSLGTNWARYDPDGWESYMSFGHILRETEIADFTDSSGLRGLSSDFLVAGQVRTQQGLALGGRMIFDENFDIAKAELRGDWSAPNVTLGGSYIWLERDDDESRNQAISELTLDGAYRVNNHWRVSGNWRYDLEDDRTSKAEIGLNYTNECVVVDFSVDRNFASSTNLEPSTTFVFTVGLQGFSAQSETESYKRSCS